MELFAEMVAKLAGDGHTNGGLGLGESAKSLKRFHRHQSRVKEVPQDVLADYLAEMMATLGVSEHKPRRPWQRTGRLPWKRLKGLQRVHFHLGHLLTLQLEGRHQQVTGSSR